MQFNKTFFCVLQMLKLSQKEGVSKPTPTGLTLDLRGSYEVQVAIHLILVQLQAFEQDMDRCLRSLEQNPPPEEAEYWSENLSPVRDIY